MKKAKTQGKKAKVEDTKAAKVAKESEVTKGPRTFEAAEPTEPRTVKAVGKYLKISPTKVHGVLDLIRGRSIEEARRVLRFSPKRGARFSLKVLDSAVANAGSVDEAGWVVFDARANKGPFFRRKRDPKARGSWGMITTPSTHLTIGIVEKVPKVAEETKVAKASKQRKEVEEPRVRGREESKKVKNKDGGKK